MKAVEIQESFGLENLKVADRPDPQPGAGEVLIKVGAVSLNYRDLLTVQGGYNPRQPLPLIPCSDGVGEVTARGDGVSRVKVGDRVAGIFAQNWISGQATRAKVHSSTLGGPLDGMLAEQVVLNAEGVVPVPDHLSDAEAATLPCAAVTAWSALQRHGNVQSGDSVLALGTGGVSIFALQFAKLMGATVLITSSSDEKLAKAKELGADHGINYKENPAWSKAVKEATNKEGVDHIVEVGGMGTLNESIRSVKMGGTISLIGVLAEVEKPPNLLPVLMNDVRIQGIIVGPRETFEEMNKCIADSGLKPIVDRVFPLEESRAAFEHMASGAHFGKICIQVASQ